VAALHQLAEAGTVPSKLVAQAIKDLKIDTEKLNPHVD
jgi:pyruvate dehydrogenase complex dehydrogenase (E1) component